MCQSDSNIPLVDDLNMLRKLFLSWHTENAGYSKQTHMHYSLVKKFQPLGYEKFFTGYISKVRACYWNLTVVLYFLSIWKPFDSCIRDSSCRTLDCSRTSCSNSDGRRHWRPIRCSFGKHRIKKKNKKNIGRMCVGWYVWGMWGYIIIDSSARYDGVLW